MKLNWEGLFPSYGNREDQMEASGSFKEGEVCFPTTYSEVTEFTARSCNAGPNRQLVLKESSYWMDLFGTISCKDTAAVLGSESH